MQMTVDFSAMLNMELHSGRGTDNFASTFPDQRGRLTDNSRSVTLTTFPIHQQAQCQAYFWGFLPWSSYLPDLWLVKWMTQAWFSMSDDIRGLTRGFQTDPLSGCQTSRHKNKLVCVYVRLLMHVLCLYASVNMCTVCVVRFQFIPCVIIIVQFVCACRCVCVCVCVC